MPNYSKLSPEEITTQTVSEFLIQQKETFSETLKSVRETVKWSLRAENVVKVYGREDRQAGKILKAADKIAGKCKAYASSKNMDTINLWDFPDIIGFTVVVSYPSDINRICEIIDGLITTEQLRVDQKTEKDAQSVKDVGAALGRLKLNSRFGRPLDERGYMGCHYNVRVPSFFEHSPLCEIQIKTAIHDAWGAKTHDLVYKSPVAIDEKLRLNFESLGDVLSQLDWQSDLLKQTIHNTARVRTGKKKAINDLILKEMQDRVVNALLKLTNHNQVQRDAVKRLVDITTSTREDDVKRVETMLINLGGEIQSKVLVDAAPIYLALHILSIKANYPGARKSANEGFSIWIEKIDDLFVRSLHYANMALFKFFSFHTIEAIELSKRALECLSVVEFPKKSSAEFEGYWRRKNSILISLAYYYAEIIGTRDGADVNATEQAKKCLDESIKARNNLSSCPTDVIDDENIKNAVDLDVVKRNVVEGYTKYSAFLDGERLTAKVQFEVESNFNCLDCELFVRTQIATNVAEINEIRRKLDILHKDLPAQIIAQANKLYDFHDYCIRQRLMELE